MRILDLVQLAPRMYRAGGTISLLGPPGCGKSQVIRDTITAKLSAEYGEPFGFYDSLAHTGRP